MNAIVAPTNDTFDIERLHSIESKVDWRFLPTIRVHHAAICQWLAVTQDADLRAHGEALRLKMEHVMRVEQAEMTPPRRFAAAAA
jgi:hypothetical protein